MPSDTLVMWPEPAPSEPSEPIQLQILELDLNPRTGYVKHGPSRIIDVFVTLCFS